jgi:hypothetical protein
MPISIFNEDEIKNSNSYLWNSGIHVGFGYPHFTISPYKPELYFDIFLSKKELKV